MDSLSKPGLVPLRKIVTAGIGFLLLATSLLTPVPVSSAPPAQEQPGKTLTLYHGDDVTESLVAQTPSDVFGAFSYRLNLPPTARLRVWLGEDGQGGCYTEARLYVGGQQVTSTRVGPQASSWSMPIDYEISGGFAQVSIVGYQACEGWVVFPVEKYVRFKVDDVGGEVIELPTATPRPTPQVSFYADRTSITRGECTTLRWETENVKAVYYQGEGVAGDGSRQECPQQTTTYELRVVLHSGGEQMLDQTGEVTVTVNQPPTAPPSETPPPANTSRPPTVTPTPTGRPPTVTPTGRPPTATPTRRPSTPAATPVAVPPPSPTPTEPPEVEPPWLLVVTDIPALNIQTGDPDAWDQIEEWLDQWYGADNVDVVDLFTEHADNTNYEEIRQALLDRVDTYTGLPDYVLIVGGPAVVAFGEYANLVPWDNDPVVPSDDLYGDLADDADFLIDVPVARLPDGGDFMIYHVQFGLNEGRANDFWGNPAVISGASWPFAEEIAEAMGHDVVQWSPPLEVVAQPPVGNQSMYLNLHGSWSNTAEFWGDDPDEPCVMVTPVPAGDPIQDCPQAKYPLAYNADWAQAHRPLGAVIAETCYSGYIGRYWAPVATADSIALSFLRTGAEAYMGFTVTIYVYNYQVKKSAHCLPWPLNDVCFGAKSVKVWPVTDGAQFLPYTTAVNIGRGDHPLDAFFKAKQDLLGTLGPGTGWAAIEEKVALSYVYYGLPPTP